MWRQQLKQGQSATEEEISETSERTKNTTSLRLVSLPKSCGTGVKQLLIVKEEAPLDFRPCADLHDPKLEHIKEEKEEVCTSLGGEQQDTVWDKEVDDIKHPVSEMKHFSESGLKTKDMDNDWKECSGPESDGNDKPFSCSEFAEQGRQFSCEDCGKTFIKIKALNGHTRIHTGEKPLCCNLCGQRFRLQSTLKRHINRIHKGYKPFCCDLCGHRFSLKPSLNRHMRIHTGERPFCCKICGKRFTRNARLIVHTRIHTGQKPFCCDECGHRFTNKSHLGTHMRIHTGEKLYCCSICGERFSYKVRLNSHMKVHTGQKPFCCHFCGQEFCLKKNLNTHIKIHAGGQIAYRIE